MLMGLGDFWQIELKLLMVSATGARWRGSEDVYGEQKSRPAIHLISLRPPLGRTTTRCCIFNEVGGGGGVWWWCCGGKELISTLS